MGRAVLFAVVLLLLPACDPPRGQEGAAGRTFALGFTPFPYDIGQVNPIHWTVARLELRKLLTVGYPPDPDSATLPCDGNQLATL